MSHLIKKQPNIPHLGIILKLAALGTIASFQSIKLILLNSSMALKSKEKISFSPSPHFPHLGFLGKVLIFPQNPHTPFRGWGLGDRGWGNP